MAEVDFADGFDISEPLLWGLTPAQLGTILGGLALGYLSFRSPLPHPAGIAMALVLGACALGIAILRVEGRTVLSWLGAATRFHLRPRARLVIVDGLSAADPAESRIRTSGARSPVWVGASTPAATRGGRTLPPPGERRSHRLVLFSLAGGSGRTTLAVEVAALLAGECPAALVDLDLLSPRASIRLGVPLAGEWATLLDSDAGGPLVAPHASGLHVVPGPAATGDGSFAADARLPARLETLLRGIEPACETVVLDIPTGLGRVARWALDAADIIAVVLTPSAGGVLDAYRSTEALRRLGHGRKLRYVVNRAQDPSLFHEAMADLGGTVAGCIPDDPELTRAEAEHRLVAAGDGPTALRLRSLAAMLGSPVRTEAVPVLRVAPLLETDERGARRVG